MVTTSVLEAVTTSVLGAVTTSVSEAVDFEAACTACASAQPLRIVVIFITAMTSTNFEAPYRCQYPGYDVEN